MAHSLRTRLTAWYATLLVVALTVFSAGVLWLHWRLTLSQVDQGIGSIASTAANVLAEELEELKDVPRAAVETHAVVHPDGYVVQVMDASGRPLDQTNGAALSVPAWAGAPDSVRTVNSIDGHSWRITTRTTEWNGQSLVLLVAAPLDAAQAQWATLLKACAIGLPLTVMLAVAGGWWLGRRGLSPLATMAGEAQAITAARPDTRLVARGHATELVQLASSFNHVLDRLSDALTTQRRFMADASHELRTPISIVRTAADVTLRKPVREEEEYRDALGVVLDQASRLTRLVDDMFVLARADGGGYPIQIGDVDVAKVIEQCARDLGPLADSRQIELRRAAQPVTLRGDEALLRRMVVNLLSNAVVYSPSGSAVRVTLTREGHRVVLRVEDSGPGIPETERERVFERFVRLDPARRAGGSGLGLAIARWIAEAHGGSLTIAASGPEGTAFEAVLPFSDTV